METVSLVGVVLSLLLLLVVVMLMAIWLLLTALVVGLLLIEHTRLFEGVVLHHNNA